MSYVLTYIAQGEHQQQDFKVRIDDSRKIAKTLVAFANTDGGRLLIGVKDNGIVCGCRVEEEVHMIEAAAEMYCEPPVEFKVQCWKVDNQNVVEISIERSHKRPHLAINEENAKRAFVRQNDRNLSANGVLRKVWEHEREQQSQNFEYDAEKEKLFDKLHDRKSLGFRAISRITKLNPHQTENMLAQLIAWEVLIMDLDGQHCSFRLREQKAD